MAQNWFETIRICTTGSKLFPVIRHEERHTLEIETKEVIFSYIEGMEYLQRAELVLKPSYDRRDYDIFIDADFDDPYECMVTIKHGNRYLAELKYTSTATLLEDDRKTFIANYGVGAEDVLTALEKILFTRRLDTTEPVVYAGLLVPTYGVEN